MQTKIGEKMYITKFFYGKARTQILRVVGGIVRLNVQCLRLLLLQLKRGWIFYRSCLEKTDIRIPAVLKEICRASTQNRHGESFEKAVGRQFAFLKAIEHESLKENRRIFIESFDEQCASSATQRSVSMLRILWSRFGKGNQNLGKGFEVHSKPFLYIGV